MVRTLITGMSGTGKSTAIAALTASDHKAIDLDIDGWSEWVPAEGDPTGGNPGYDWLWNECNLTTLLANCPDEPLFVSGCAPNMGKFTPRFDHIVLLSAPIDVILNRVASRTNNDYGKCGNEAAQIVANLKEFEPRLRAIATCEIDTSLPLEEVLLRILNLG